MAVARSSSVRVTKYQGEGTVFGRRGSSPIDNALYSIDREVGVSLLTAGEV